MKPQSIIQQALNAGIALFVEDGKLGFKMAKGAQFPDELKTLIKTHKAEVIAYFEAASSAYNNQQSVDITPVARDGALPLSFAQQRMWFIDQMEQGSAVYNMPLALRISGEFDASLAERAINIIIERHEVLRTVIVQHDEQVQQQVLPKAEFHLPVVNLSEFDAKTMQDKLDKLIAQNASHIFNLAQDLMLNACFVRCRGEHTQQGYDYLLINVHHIASDGWSQALLLKEFSVIYQALLQGSEPALAPLPIQYADFAHWQRQHLQGEVLAAQLDYWRAQLAGIPEVHSLPLLRPRGQYKQHQGAQLSTRLPVELSDSLQQLAQHFELTPFMLLHSALALVFTRHSYSHDIAIGTPVAGRKVAALNDLIGLFVNTLVLRVDTDKTALGDYFAHVRKVNLEAQAHQDIPFEQLVEQTKVTRSTAHSPLFQIMFSMNTNDYANTPVTGLKAEVVSNPLENVKFDMDISARFDDDGLSINWVYDQALFGGEQMRAMSEHLLNVLADMARGFATSPQALASCALAEVQMLSPHERDTILQSLSQADEVAQPIDGRLFYQRFEAIAAQSPEKPALRHVDEQGESLGLSYGELNAKANQWAHYLQSLGVRHQSNVGLCLNRGLDMLVAILAIHKLGASYVSLDPSYPQSRLDYIVEDTGSPVVLIHQDHAERLSFADEVAVVVLDSVDFIRDCANLPGDNIAKPAALNDADLALIIYTSGSTGKPKGVMLTQRNIMALLDWGVGYFSAEELSCVFAGTSLNFDLSIFELFTPLSVGGSCVIAQSILSLLDHQGENSAFDGITLINSVPSAVGAVVAATELPESVTTVITAGEAMTQGLAQRLYQQRGVKRVVSLYGPTEDTVYSSCAEVKRDENGVCEVPNLGRMFPHSSGYIVDIYGQLAGVGCIGQLYIGGEGLARGYWRREELTAERFVQGDSIGVAQRLYISGDLVHYLPNGQMRFVARVDQQVKIRGFRIELGEIETQLLADERVSKAAMAVFHLDGHPQLAAYVVAKESVATEGLSQALTAKLSAELPQYMVPASIMLLEQLPYMPNGKLDKKALPPIGVNKAQDEYAAPSTETELVLRQIWAEVLGKDQQSIGVNQNFFALGGDSILSIQVVSKALQQGLRFTIKDMFNAQTIEQLALVAVRGSDIDAPQGLIEGDMALLPIHQRFFSQPTDVHHYNQAVMLSVASEFDFAALNAVFEKLVQHHDALRLSFNNVDGNWQGQFGRFDANRMAQALENVTIKQRSEIEAYSDMVQGSLSLEEGRLFKAVLFSQQGEQSRLLLVFHHLLIDGVSWRVLLEDLNQLYQQRLDNKPLSLPAKTSSYQQWAAFLHAYRQTPALLAEQDYWQQTMALADKPSAMASAAALENDEAIELASASMSLTHEQTKALLDECSSSYRTEINELLLAGLLLAYQRTFNDPLLAIDLEGHGREALSDTLDLSRTIGWFTSLYPLVMQLPQNTSSVAEAINSVKRAYRALPHNGIGFGVLSEIDPVEPLKARQQGSRVGELVFNYLGQFNQSTQASGHFGFADEASGRHISPNRYPSHPMALNGLVGTDGLSFSLTYDAKRYLPEQMTQLMDAYAAALVEIIGHCQNVEQAPFIACDFADAKLSDAEFNAAGLAALEQLQDVYPATKMQQGLLFHSLLTEGQYVTQMQVGFVDLDLSLMAKAWQLVVEHNTVFRTGFIGLEQGNAHQVVYQSAKVPWHTEDLSGLSDAEQQKRIAERMAADKIRGFELNKAPLMRVSAFACGQSQQLVWSFHHALVDGWSLPLVFAQLVACYQSLKQNTPLKLPVSKPFKAHVQWLMAQDSDKAVAYWREQLQGVEGSTALPLASNRPEQSNSDAAHVELMRLDGAQSEQLSALAKACNTTVNVIVQGAWALLLSRHQGAEQVVFGATNSGRPPQIAGVDKMVGLFINTLPVVVNIEQNQGLKSWFGQLHQELVEREAYSYLPLAEILALSPNRDGLFDSLLVFENYPVDKAIGEASAQASLKVTSVNTFEGTNYGLTLMAHFTDTLSVRFMAQQKRYSKAAVVALSEQFKQLLVNICKTQDVEQSPVKQLQLLSVAEQQAKIAQLNKSANGLAHEYLLHQWLEVQADKTPQAPALSLLTAMDAPLSYQALNHRANRLAHYLRANYLSAHDAPFVGVCLNRGIDALVAILAVLKAGGCYVPLDPNYPAQRLAYIAEDTGLPLVLAERDTVENLTAISAAKPQVEVCLLDDETLLSKLDGHSSDNLDLAIALHQRAYVIYTSGSTGKPKGVLISHKNAAALLNWSLECFSVEQMRKVLASTSFNFDLSIFEIFAPLAFGGECVVATSILQLVDEGVDAQGLSLINTVPSGISALLAENAVPQSVTTVNLAGEPLSRNIVSQLYQTGHIEQVYNLYGPSEDTTYSLAALVPDDDSLPLIGRPISNTIAYVVDNGENIAASGVVGELYLAGDGVALGYLNRAALTQEQFINDPFAQLHRLQQTDKAYKTGDLVRYVENRDGDLALEYIGRVDNQLKLRGFRIEPGEIEHEICRLAQVNSAQVIVHGSLLTGYVQFEQTPQDAGEAIEAVEQWLSTRLPEHMVPGAFVVIEQWPLTPNGKIDKARLPLPNQLSADKNRIAPRNDIEARLLPIWAKLLRLDAEQISIDDNFHRLGGDSILSLQVVAMARREGLHFSVKDLFDAPTIGALAQKVSLQARDQKAREVSQGEQILLPIAQAFAEDLTDWHHYNQAVMLTTPLSFELSLLRQMLSVWVAQHDVLRLVFKPQDNDLSASYRRFDEHTLNAHIFEHCIEVELSEAELASGEFADSVQRQLDPANGVLFKAVLIKDTDEKTRHLLLVMHHLIVDGISWRVLLSELIEMYQRYRSGAPLQLSQSSNSYQQWANWLASDEFIAKCNQALEYWQDTTMRIEPHIYAADNNTPASASTAFDSVQLHIEKAVSDTLLGRGNKPYRTQVNELLLAGLLHASNTLCGTNELVIALEGHGRETDGSELEIGQTLGWFTSLYPLLLSAQQSNDIGALICAVKEQYRQVPDKGLSFGVLKYLAKALELIDGPTPELLFNYLGQFEQVVAEQSDFYWADAPVGTMASANRHSRYGLTLNGLQSNDGLSFTLSYDTSRYSVELIKRLLTQLKLSLTHVAEHCENASGALTPSDFPLANVDSATLNDWQQHYPIADLYRASGMQQGLLFQSMLHQGSYTNQKLFTFKDLNLTAFKAAWQQVVDNHGVFRTSFVGIDSGNAHQLVQDSVQLPWHYQDISEQSAAEQSQFIEQYRLADKAKGFDIAHAPLMRISVFELGDNRQQLLWSVHHALLDGWCLPLVFAEVTQYYRAISQGEVLTPATPKASYKDYIAWLNGQDLSVSENYWRERLSGFEHKTPLPLVTGAANVEGQKHAHSLRFDDAFSGQLQAFANAHEVTLNVLVQAAWALTLSQFNAAPKAPNSVVFGAVTSGRPPELEGVESIVGLFINSVALVVDIAPQMPLRQWLKTIHQELVAAESHAHVPLKDIQRLSPATEGLFDSLLVFENYPVDETIGEQAQSAALMVEAIDNFEGTDDAMALVVHTGRQLTMELTIGANLLSHADGERLVGHLHSLLGAMLTNADKPLGEIDWLTPNERQALLAQATGVTQGKDYSGTLLSRFEQVVANYGEHIAIDDNGELLSYQALDALANHFATQLKAQGVVAGDSVGVCAPRSQALIVGMLAVLKVGGAYVPLGQQMPQERLEYMCRDTGLSVVLSATGDVAAGISDDLAITEIALNWDNALLQSAAALAKVSPGEIDEQSLAYVLYTSGSTGLPKGVKVTQQNVLRCVYGDTQIAVDEQSKVVYCANPVFDASTWEIWTSLLHGSCLIVITEAQLLDVAQFKQRLEDSNASVLQLTAGLFRQLAEPLAQTFSQLDYLLIGGDKPDIAAVRTTIEAGAPKHFIHTYGPTETVAFTTIFAIDADSAKRGRLPIGRATYDSQAYVLDAQGQLLPQGAVGLLHIGGSGVAQGYLNLPQQSAEAFIANPFGTGRLYNTGDLVRFIDNGDILFVGRQDEQVKIRGYRIELGEIEYQLNRFDGVKSSLVRVMSDDAEQAQDKRLIAYVEASSGVTLDVTALRVQLSQTLPNHMVPGMLIAVDSWPLTANGKIDVKALPTPQTGLITGHYQAPVGSTELQLQQLWAELLQLDCTQISTRANFFALGGDSILSIQLVARAAKQGLHFSVKDLFDAPTITALAAVVSTERQLLSEQGQLTGPVPLLPVQQAFLADTTDWHHANQSVMLATTDFEPQALAPIAKALLEQHDVLRLRFSLTQEQEQEQDQEQGQWQSEYLPLTDELLAASWQVQDMPQGDSKNLTALADKVQRSLNPAQGELFKLVYFKPLDGQKTKAGQASGRLLMVIHHLAVDGVSWRILLDDLHSLYGQYVAKAPLSLGQKTTSYRQWGELLAGDVAKAHFSEQAPYWQTIVSGEFLDISEQNSAASGTYHSAQLSIDAATTEALLTQCTSVYRAQINELLLGAVLLGTSRFAGQNKPLALMLESHGRELSKVIERSLQGAQSELSQTLGWFTQSYPLLLESAGTEDITGLINQVKSQYRNVPDGGMGYGVLKHMHQLPELKGCAEPKWLFNYLGQFDNSSAGEGMFTQAKESVGTQTSERRKPEFELSFNGMVSQGELWFEVSFIDERYSDERINGLLESIKAAIIEIVATANTLGAMPLVAVDFPYSGASDQDIAKWQDEYDIADIYPASGTQQGMLFHSMLHAGSYVTQTLVHLDDLDVARFAETWQMLIDHHDIFRTAFVSQQDGQSQQLVVKQASPEWQLHDLTGLSNEAQESAIEAFLAADKAKGFVTEQAPLLRFNLFDRGNSRHTLVWSHHHAIMDGWSLPLLFAQVRAIYAGLGEDNSAEHITTLKAALPSGQYGAYAKWLAAQDNQASLDYWAEQLADVKEVTPLPMVSTQVAFDLHKEALQYSLSLSQAQTSALVSMARNANTTVGVLLQAAWACLLSRYSAREQVVFGATTSGRPPTLNGVEQMVGLFINTVPVSADLSGHQRFIDVVAQMHQLQAVRELHSHIPLVEIQRQSALKQNLFETIVVFENYPVSALSERSSDAHDLQVSGISFVEDSNFGLNLVAHLEDQLSLQLLVHDARFEQAQVEDLVESLADILNQVGQNPDLAWRDLAVNGKLAIACGEQKPLSLAPDLASQFERQAKLSPDNTAAIFAATEVSYGELECYVNRFAAVLEESGVEQGQLVGVYLERSLSMLVSVLALSKLGAVFVALEPSQPQARIAAIIDDAQIDTVVTCDMLLDSLSHNGVDVVVVEDFIADPDAFSEYDGDEVTPRALAADALAYVLYTSGSSGKPKGVKIKHSGLMNYLDHGVNQYLCDGVTGSVVSSPLCFDATLTTLLAPLMCGGSVMLAGNDEVLFDELAEQLMHSSAPLLFKLTPAHMTVLLSYFGEQSSLQSHKIVIGGEQLSVSQLKPWVERYLPNGRYINEYGPTETVVGCCIYEVAGAQMLERINSSAVPIGQPIQNTRLYVTDDNLKILPKGAMGQLFIAGAGVCEGYLNRDELSGEVLLDDLTEQGALAYRSGDRVILHHNDCFEFIARCDEQLKVNGYRIEPADIEYHLNADERVKQAIVHLWQAASGNNELVAYVQWHQTGDFGQLSAALAKALPAYMCPQHYEAIEQWPLTVNGKIDRRALPAPMAHGISDSRQLPQTPLESKLLDIWCQALKSAEIGVTDSFFQAGGDSILALIVIGQCRQQGIELSVSELLSHGTIRALAAYLESEGRTNFVAQAELEPFALLSEDEKAALELPGLSDAYPQTLLQQGMIFHTMQGQLEGVYHDISTIRLKLSWDETVFRQALLQMAERHEMLRAVFDMSLERPLVLVKSQMSLPLSVVDLRGHDKDAQQAAIEQWLAQEKRRGFALDICPWQITVQLLGEQEVCLHLSFHHALLDGWSRASLETELFERYHQLLAGHDAEPLSTPLPYRHFVGLEAKALACDKAKQHWLEIVQEAPMPWWSGAADRGQSYHVDFNLSAEKATAIGQLAAQLNVHEKSVLMALHVVICGLLDGQTKVLTSSVYNTRPELAGSELTLGLFLNALPLSVDFADMSWRELIVHIDEQQLAGMAHRYYPVTDIQRQSGVDLSGSLFNFVDFHVYEQVSQSADMVSRGAFDRNNYWLQSAFERGDNGSLSVGLILDSGVFKPALFDQLKAPIAQLLNGFVDGVDKPVPTSLTPQPSAPMVLDESIEYRRVWQQFDHVAKLAPNSCALRVANEQISYRELASKASMMAAQLLAKGLSGDVVVLHLTRSIDMVTALLGAAKAGITYVPLDPALPQARKQKLIAQSTAKLVLSDEPLSWQDEQSALECLSPQQLLEGDAVTCEHSSAEFDDNAAAYVIFTSGSTGEPKGVAVSHRALGYHLAGARKRIDNLGCTSRWLAVTTLSFDIAALEILAPLLSGAELVLADEQQSKDPSALAALIEQHQITHMQATPATWTALIDSDWQGTKQLSVLCGGEALTVNLASALLPKVARLYNCYGPTEATIWSMISQVTLVDLNKHQIELSGTLPGYAHCVVNAYGQAVPPGIPGQLCIAGHALANGYFNNQGLTDKAFITRVNAKGEDERWYLSGDNVIATGADSYVYLGRIDHQVKVNGHRVELGEIQYQADSFEGVSRSVVTSFQDAQGFTGLALYVVPDERVASQDGEFIAALKAHLSARLPRYMVPHAIMVLDALPLNANGKVDLKQLEKPQFSRLTERVAPRNELEQQVLDIFAQLLGASADTLSVNDDFFSLGGHSLLLVQLLSRVRKRFEVEVALTEFMTKASVAGLAELIDAQQALSAVTESEQGEHTLSF